MTIQSRESLKYNGKWMGMMTTPLDQYQSKLENPPELLILSTNCWRGYNGAWEIKENKLFLTGLSAYIKDLDHPTEVLGNMRKGVRQVGVELYFPGKAEVFADWFTGELSIPMGEVLKPYNLYSVVHEKELHMEFKNGVLVKSWVLENKTKMEDEDDLHKPPESRK